MKNTNLFKGLALGVMFTLSTVAFAGGEKAEGTTTSGTISISPYLNTDYSIVSLNSSGAKNSLLTIKSSDGEVYYKEWISNTTFTQKVLDFSYLADGEYSITLSGKGNTTIKELFTVENKKIVSLNKKEESTGLTSFVNHVDNALFVSHIALGVNSFGVSIFDNNNDEVYSDIFAGNVSFSKKFDISKLPTGNYQVNINSNKMEYSYAFTK